MPTGSAVTKWHWWILLGRSRESVPKEDHPGFCSAFPCPFRRVRCGGGEGSGSSDAKGSGRMQVPETRRGLTAEACPGERTRGPEVCAWVSLAP